MDSCSKCFLYSPVGQTPTFCLRYLTIVWIILYLFSLEIEEVSAVAPWFLTVPFFGYILGYIFLGETLTLNQLIGAGIIFAGLFFISLNFGPEKKESKGKHVFYMIFACLAIAISGIIFKYVTVGNNFWVSSFWNIWVWGCRVYLFFCLFQNTASLFCACAEQGVKQFFW